MQHLAIYAASHSMFLKGSSRTSTVFTYSLDITNVQAEKKREINCTKLSI